MRVCQSCDQEVNSDWKFCVFCREPLTPQNSSGTTPSDTLTQNLGIETLAHRVKIEEMQGWVNKTLVVNEGQQALLFKGGRLDTTLTPGSHPMGNILGGQLRESSVVLFNTADIPLTISIPRLMSKDPLPLAMDFRLTLGIREPLHLWTNLMGDAELYESQHLVAALYPVVEEACHAFARSRSVFELDAASSVMQELGLSLASHLDQSLTRWGLRLVSCQATSMRCEAWDDVTKTRSAYSLAASQEEAGLEGRKRLFDVHQGLELQTLAEETASIVVLEQRAALWERMRQALLADAKGEIQSQTDLENLVRQADRDHLLKEDEHQSLIATLAEAKDDHQKAREFMLRQVESEGEYELKKLDLSHRFGLSEERLSLELVTSRHEMEGRWELELQHLNLRIEQKRRLAAFQREQSESNSATENQRRLDAASTTAAIQDIERDQDDQDVRAALAWQAQYTSQKRIDSRERQDADLSADLVRSELKINADKHDLENQLELSRSQHDNDLARIEALSQVGIETLIAVSGIEQGELLAQLARTQSLSACTPTQIMAMQAHESPQVAAALKEILTATVGGGQLDQYERLINELKESGRNSREDNQRNLVTLTEMFGKALDSVRDTAAAFGTAPRPDSVVVDSASSVAAPEGNVTFLFSEIVDSLVMTEKLGDLRSQEILHTHNDIIRREVEGHGGIEVKSAGDWFMLAFSDGRDAVLCAVSIQRALAGLDSSGFDWKLSVRIGLHSGEVIKEENDYSGRTVILTRRIASKADGGQILVSSLLKEITESTGDFQYGNESELELKGLDGTSRVFPVAW
jgi:class 3 adenylate cyclase